ncbi:MAG: response regulator [Deltaproteobacteria bacterium]|nr:response regulator [Deltaproteobacteria bacterium]
MIVIDDDEIMLLSCKEILGRIGYTVETFASGEEGLKHIARSPAALLVVDLKMPQIDGLEVIRRVREIDPAMVIIVITGYSTISTAVQAMKAGAYDFLPKPFTPEELVLIVNRGYERWRLAMQSARLRDEKEHLQRVFVTFVSHQLKTPLVAVKQYLDVLMHDSQIELPQRARQWISRSQYRVAELTGIIDDWLDLSRAEHGGLCDRKVSTDLQEVIEGVVKSLGPLAKEAGVRLTLEFAPTPLSVIGDRGSLEMVLSNLISNGIKYNRSGGSLIVRTSLDDSTVVLEVADTGLGIPEACQERLFEEFYRVKTDATAEIPGSGLGLTLCQTIVEELEGKISVHSEEGVGTTFTVRLLPGTRVQ